MAGKKKNKKGGPGPGKEVPPSPAATAPKPEPASAPAASPGPASAAGSLSPAEREKQRKKNLPWSLWIKENVEAFFFAVILVLIVRYFSVEAFQIPTKSMEPTLLGDPKTGDRILVDKFVYNFSDPKRWDVVVFKYPLNRSRNFIKRLVGMPEDRIAIRNGDIFVGGLEGKTQRKPESVQDELWVPVAEAEGWMPDGTVLEGLGPAPVGLADLAASRLVNGEKWVPRSERPRDDRNKFVEDYDPFRPTCGVRDRSTNLVPDARLAIEATVAGGDGGIRAIFETEEVRPAPDGSAVAFRYTFDVGVAGGTLPTRIRVESAPSPAGPWTVVEEKDSEFRIERGKKYSIEAIRVDGWASLRVGDHLVERPETRLEVGDDLTYAKATESTERSAAGFGPVGQTKIEVEDVELERDVYYTNRDDNEDKVSILAPGLEIEIPEGRYLLLGDNSPNSRDSRLWGIFRIEARTGDVLEVIEGEYNNHSNADESNPKYAPGGREPTVLEFRDTNGFDRSIRWLDIERVEIIPWLHEHMPFPRRDPSSAANEPINSKGKSVFDTSQAFFRIRRGERPRRLTKDEAWVATVPRELIVGRAFFVFFPFPPVSDTFRWKFIR